MNTSEKLIELIGMGWTQCAISESTGVPQGTLSRIVTGETKDPRASNAYAIDRLHAQVIKKNAAPSKATA